MLTNRGVCNRVTTPFLGGPHVLCVGLVYGCTGRGCPQDPAGAGCARAVTAAIFWHDGKRMFVVEQAGRIRLITAGKVQSEPYLDIVQKVKSGGECGLLSVAFSPKFQENGLFYVNYTRQQGKLQTVVSEFRADPSAGTASAETERVILTIDQPFANHNGGHILFGPDGMLYIGMGDGGQETTRTEMPRTLGRCWARSSGLM